MLRVAGIEPAAGGATIFLGVVVCLAALPFAILSLRWRRGRTARARGWVRTLPLDAAGSQSQSRREFAALCIVPSFAICGFSAGLGLTAVAFPLPIALALVAIAIAVMLPFLFRYGSWRNTPYLDPATYPQWLRAEREAEYQRLEDAGLIARRASRDRGEDRSRASRRQAPPR